MTLFQVVICILFNTLLENQELKETVRWLLKDEINRLKGEQGRPKIRPQKKSGDFSSESERQESSPPKRPKRKKRNIVVHQEKICPVEKEKLPKDAVFKEYDDRCHSGYYYTSEKHGL